MRQRTVFASALVHEPKVLVVDEPTVGLDPKNVRKLKDLLRRQAEAGTTVFLSSHSLDVVEQLADRIAIVDHGRLVSCGSLEALRETASLDGTLEDVFLRLTEETTPANGYARNGNPASSGDIAIGPPFSSDGFTLDGRAGGPRP
jgi:ABC-2 type transport system ATP-binding protein